jgi:hypothetical protein
MLDLLSSKICSITDCNSKVIARTLCTKHYSRVIRHGTIILPRRKPPKKKIKEVTLCKEVFEEKRIVVDHNHLTGKVRGLLHNQCNVLLGFAEDNINKLKKAIEYLEEKERV